MDHTKYTTHSLTKQCWPKSLWSLYVIDSWQLLWSIEPLSPRPPSLKMRGCVYNCVHATNFSHNVSQTKCFPRFHCCKKKTWISSGGQSPLNKLVVCIVWGFSNEVTTIYYSIQSITVLEDIFFIHFKILQKKTCKCRSTDVALFMCRHTYTHTCGPPASLSLLF